MSDSRKDQEVIYGALPADDALTPSASPAQPPQPPASPPASAPAPPTSAATSTTTITPADTPADTPAEPPKADDKAKPAEPDPEEVKKREAAKLEAAKREEATRAYDAAKAENDKFAKDSNFPGIGVIKFIKGPKTLDPAEKTGYLTAGEKKEEGPIKYEEGVHEAPISSSKSTVKMLRSPIRHTARVEVTNQPGGGQRFEGHAETAMLMACKSGSLEVTGGSLSPKGIAGLLNAAAGKPVILTLDQNKLDEMCKNPKDEKELTSLMEQRMKGKHLPEGTQEEKEYKEKFVQLCEQEKKKYAENSPSGQGPKGKDAANIVASVTNKCNTDKHDVLQKLQKVNELKGQEKEKEKPAAGPGHRSTLG